MNWRTYTYEEIKSMFPPRRHSIKTLKAMVRNGDFGEFKRSTLSSTEVLLAEDAIEVYLNKQERTKKLHKKEKQQEKDKKFSKSVDTHFKVWKHPPTEYRIAAKIAFKNALTTPSMMEGIASCKGGVETKEYLKQRYEEFYARVQWGHVWKAKRRAWSNVRQRAFFESALDLKTQVRLLFDENEQAYFWQQFVAYALHYGLADPVKKDIIKQIIFESIYIQKRRGQLVMLADDVIDKTFLSDLNVSQERFLKLVNVLNAIHYRRIVPTGKVDEGKRDDIWDPTNAGENIK